MLTGNATSIETAHASGQFVIASVHESVSIKSIAKDITPDISNDMKKENVWK